MDGLSPAPGIQAKKAKRHHYCGYCAKSFSRCEHRTRHERSHTKETPFPCLHCSKSFARKDLLVRHNRSLHKVAIRPEATEEDDATVLTRSTSAQVGTKWHTWHPPQTAQAPRRETAARTYTTEQSVEHASTQDHGIDSAFFQQNDANSGDIGITGMQDLHDHGFIANDHFGPDPIAAGSVEPSAEEVYAMPDRQLSNLALLNDTSIDSALIEPFFEPDWINNLDFSTSTYWSVFQTALPLWPTTTWSPTSLSQPPQSPQACTANLQKTLPTPGSSRQEHFDIDKPEGTRPLLDRVFPQIPHPDTRSGSRPATLEQSPQVTAEIRSQRQQELEKFRHNLPRGFSLPSHHALNRYQSMYFVAGARHQPFIHESTWSPEKCSFGLFLAVCAMGARYCFEDRTSQQLWKAGKTVIRCTIDEADRRSGDENYVQSSTDSLENCQGMLLLMMYATWAGGTHFLRQALAFQSELAAMIREIHPERPPETEHMDWRRWIAYEAQKRTKFVVFCFFNLQCLTYDLPAMMLHSEVDLELPCGEELWRANMEDIWTQRQSQESNGTPRFQQAMRTLLDQGPSSSEDSSGQNTPAGLSYSIFGSYVLINGLMQHSSELRRYARSLSGDKGALSADQSRTFERALRRWQKGWENHPKASLDPQDPHGPLAFNCTALLRMAYIRLEMDFAPYAAALRSGDPQIVGRTIWNEPAAKRSRSSMRAALHAWHALLIPIRLGIDLVAQTQVFSWSIQHFIASFECCLLLAKWLDAVTVDTPSPSLSDEERWLIKLVQDTLQEAGIETVNDVRTLSSSILTTWARLFYGNKIWGVIPLWGDALTKFADLLSERSMEIG